MVEGEQSLCLEVSVPLVENQHMLLVKFFQRLGGPFFTTELLSAALARLPEQNENCW